MYNYLYSYFMLFERILTTDFYDEVNHYNYHSKMYTT